MVSFPNQLQQDRENMGSRASGIVFLSLNDGFTLDQINRKETRLPLNYFAPWHEAITHFRALSFANCSHYIKSGAIQLSFWRVILLTD